MLTESGIFALPKIPTLPSFNIAAFWKPISFKVLPSHFSWSKSILVIMEISESNRFTGSYLPPMQFPILQNLVVLPKRYQMLLKWHNRNK